MAKRLVWLGLVGVLTGCPGGKDDTTTSTTGTPSGSTVTTVAQPPAANDDLADVDEGGSTTINVAANDLVTSNPLALGSVTVVDPPQFGTVTVQTDGTTQYTHDASETTADVFTYTIEDSAGVPSNVASVLISVGPVNDAPVAVDDSGVVGQGATEPLNLVANDSDVDDGLDLGAITIVDPPTLGTLNDLGNGTVEYSHTAAGQGQYDSFTYTIADNSGASSNVATVDLVITLVNVPPVAQDDIVIVNEGDVATVDLSANDFDVDDGIDPASISINSSPSNGSLVVNANGTVDYTHDGSEVGSDSFSYIISDLGGSTSNVASVLVTVFGVNDAPVAVDDSAAVNERATVNIPVVGNDTDVDDAIDPTSLAVVASPAYGALTVQADGSIDYAHDGSQITTDSFSYTVQDMAGAMSNVATVDLNITLINDPPDPVDDVANVDEGSSVDVAVLANDTDSDDAIDTSSVAIATPPAFGTAVVLPSGEVQYTHDGSETAADSFTYTVDDIGGGTSVPATVSVSVNPVNDPPVANADSGTVLEANIGTFDLAGNDTDVDGTVDVGSIAIVSPPAYGSINIVGDGTVDFTHDGVSQQTSDSFSYTIDDDSGATSAPATVSVTVTQVNDPPMAMADGDVVDEGGLVNVAVLDNDSDSDDSIDVASVVITVPPLNGNAVVLADGSVDYTHDGSETLSDSFGYTVDDAGGNTSNTATVSISVNPINDSPVGAPDSATVDEGSSGNSIDVLANDSDADDGLDPSSIVILAPPAFGVATPGAGMIQYDHDGSEGANDSFSYRVFDNSGAQSNPVTVSITVNPINDPPVAGNDSYTVSEGSSGNVLSVRSNDTDADDGLAPGFNIISGPVNGGITVGATSITYDHNGSETLSDSFQYTVNDLSGAPSNVATVSITVTPVNDPPVANGDSAVVDQGDVVVIPVSANDTDVDGVVASPVTIISPPANGNAVVSGLSVTYTHNNTPTVSDSFTYTIGDNSGATSNTATVNITVNPPACDSVTFYNYSGGVQTFVAPCDGVYWVDLYGAQGIGNPSNGGLGGLTSVEVALTEGEILEVRVGGMNGYNGGGIGFAVSPHNGGGATDIRRYGAGLDHRIAVAGGGGASSGDADYQAGHGGGGTCFFNYCGGGGGLGYSAISGTAGGLEGGTGATDFHSGGAGGGGLRSGGAPSCNTGYGGSCGGPGLLGVGGDGDTWETTTGFCYLNRGGTAAGGGGYMGGGGTSVGNCGGGAGGGGSSWAGPVVSRTLAGGVQFGDGSAVIGWAGNPSPAHGRTPRAIDGIATWHGGPVEAYWTNFGSMDFDSCQAIANSTGLQWFGGSSAPVAVAWLGDHDAVNATVDGSSWPTEVIVPRTDLYPCVLADLQDLEHGIVSPAEQTYIDSQGRVWHYWDLIDVSIEHALSFARARGARIINPNSVGQVGLPRHASPSHWNFACAEFNGAGSCNFGTDCDFFVGYYD